MRMDFAQMSEMQSVNVMQTLSSTNYREVPAGYTAVYMYDEPVAIIPNEMKQEVMELAYTGCHDLREDRVLVVLLEMHTKAGKEFGGMVTDMIANYVLKLP